MTSDPLAPWWDLTYVRRVQPEMAGRRPCGCYLDPVVFGHYHPADVKAASRG